MMLNATRPALQQASRAIRRQQSDHCRFKDKRWSSAYSLSLETEEAENSTPPPLVGLEQARLGYPSSGDKCLTPPLDLSVHHPSAGGHALLGRNGSHKTLLSKALVSHGHPDYLHEGSFLTNNNNNTIKPHHISHVSFESHQELLAQGGGGGGVAPNNNNNAMTTYKAIAPSGNLNKAAQFLIVRFGLFPLLHRDVSTLSTGEIRKVLLVRALSHRPRLLVLDNAFDGLDVPSRQSLKDLVSKTLRGFRPDILVQGITARATAHTQVLMITQRPEELVEEMQFVSWYCEEQERSLVTEHREGRSGRELLASALMGVPRSDGDGGEELLFVDGVMDEKYLLSSSSFSSSLPTREQVAAWWQQDATRTSGRVPFQRAQSSSSSSSSSLLSPNMVVQARQLQVRRGDATLIQDLDWTVERGQRWLVAGGNGQGKSTLSRLVARQEGGVERGHLVVSAAAAESPDIHQHNSNDNSNNVEIRPGVGWVSTELHMAHAHSTKKAWEILRGNVDASSSSSSSSASTSTSACGSVVAEWLQLDASLMSRPFAELSQGQQKLVLIAAAMEHRPQLLVLDEPCQGLDLLHRRQVLGLVEQVCRATDMSLIYITHHLEEMLPCVGHVLHLQQGRAVYCGRRDQYIPEDYQVSK